MLSARKPIAFSPMAQLNMTPLIDVLLVLLVMLILTIPVATHTLAFQLPSEAARPPINEDTNRLTLTESDRYLWNGESIDAATLLAVLQRSSRMRPEPQLQIAPDGRASYGASAELMRLVKASGVTNVGFVGNERYRKFTGGPD